MVSDGNVGGRRWVLPVRQISVDARGEGLSVEAIVREGRRKRRVGRKVEDFISGLRRELLELTEFI